MQRIRAAMATVALLSDDALLIAQVVSLLSDESTTVDVHRTLGDLIAALATGAPDVVVIQDNDVSDASHEIRLLRRRLPSIHLVYVNVQTEQRGISLLHWGADDTVTTDSAMLMARLQAATRRARTLNAGSRIALGDIIFDREARRVWCAGREVDLTPHEYSVVDCLFWHAPTPVGIDTLADFVWGDQESANKRTLVQVYVSYVRKKLAASAQVAIRFARGSGYEFSPRDDESQP